jgi:hypothetical protein
VFTLCQTTFMGEDLNVKEEEEEEELAKNIKKLLKGE